MKILSDVGNNWEYWVLYIEELYKIFSRFNKPHKITFARIILALQVSYRIYSAVQNIDTQFFCKQRLFPETNDTN